MAGGRDGLLEEISLGEGPLRKRRRFGARSFAETDLGVAVLKLFHNFWREGTTAGHFGEVFGHLAEDIGSSVGEEQDCSGVGLGHAWIILYWYFTSADDQKWVGFVVVLASVYPKGAGPGLEP
jgi:hypothetical protein